MIVALLALAAAMMIAGVTAVIEGFPYVRLESGMAMVYGGAVVGSSGALLLGFAAVVAAVKRVERAVGAGRLAAVTEDGPVAIGPLPKAEAARKAEPFHDPIADELRLMEAPSVEPSPMDRPRIEPSLVAPPPRSANPAPADTVQVDLLGLAAPAPGEVPNAPAKAPTVTVRPPTIPTRPTPVEAKTPDEDEAARNDPFADLLGADLLGSPKPERTPVGRYSSEGNTYVMFDDGSIEADTPKGRYTFSSLDELKAFVDNGGERNARGAA